MTETCLSREQILAHLTRIAPDRAAAELHLSGCATCRQRLHHVMLERQMLAAPMPAAPPRRRLLQPATGVAALFAVLLGGWWLDQRPGELESGFRSGEPAYLSAAGVVSVDNGDLQLQWNAHPQAIGYRLRCYVGSGAAWLDRATQESTLTLTSSQWRAAPRASVCRVDAQVPAGDWVIGAEQSVAP